MRDDTSGHTVELEHSGNLDEQGRGIGGGGRGACPRSGSDTSNLNLVCPTNQESRVVLPMHIALEQVGTRSVCRSVDKSNSRGGSRIVDFDTLTKGSETRTNTPVLLTHKVVRPCD